MFSYIKEIQKRNIDTGRGFEWGGVSGFRAGDGGWGWGWGGRSTWKGGDRRNVRQSEGISGTHTERTRADEQNAAVPSSPSLPTPPSPLHSPPPPPPPSGNKMEFQFYKRSSKAELLQEADVISLVEFNLSGRSQKLSQSTFGLTDKHGGQQVGL